VSIAYHIPVPGAKLQAVGGADRPICALTSALTSLYRGVPLRGSATGMSMDDAAALVLSELLALGVPNTRACRWAVGLMTKTPDMVVPSTVMGMTLSPYQIQAAARMTQAGGVLAMGCGLGKTLTAVAYAQALIAPARVLIICPLNAVSVWKRMLPGLPKDTQIVSMDSAHKIAEGLTPTGGLVIFDEAHMLGERTARRTEAAHLIRSKFDAGLCLTGTLLHSGIDRALSVQDLAVPGAALFANRWKAGEHFHCLVRKPLGQRTVTSLVAPEGANRDAFLSYLNRIVVALDTRSTEVRASVQLPDQHLYDLRLGEPWASLTKLAADIITDEVAAGMPPPSAPDVAHRLCRAGAQEKVDWLLAELGQDPCVVFAHYTETLDLAEAALTAAGIPLVRVDGSVTGAARAEAVRAFQAGEVQVFLGQMTASGVAVDLYRARFSVALDHPWRSADYTQALARTCRRGQTQECHHWDLIANPLQARVVDRLRAGADFNAALPEYQELKLGMASAVTNSGIDTNP
jgi:SNF2 family DNA or RNA helicase